MVSNKKPTVLIVEDDEILLRALYLLFHKENYTIASATDGDTGLKMSQRLKPEIIILDLLLPKMDGFDVLKYLKADPNLKDTPVVVLSNLGDDHNIKEAMSLGATDYFVKAKTDLSDLAKKIEDILKKTK